MKTLITLRRTVSPGFTFMNVQITRTNFTWNGTNLKKKACPQRDSETTGLSRMSGIVERHVSGVNILSQEKPVSIAGPSIGVTFKSRAGILL